MKHNANSPKQPNERGDRKEVKKEWTKTGPTGEKSAPSYERERNDDAKQGGNLSSSRLNRSGSNGIPEGQQTTLNTSEIQEGGKGNQRRAG